eukprot:TRINITY_DN7304_c5_g1_i1.p1 TRINITY_DN7304_c5_g1~~TRINITY_DN7304_c5_g1_i1.p1  ORF type:complete len:680 (+),score=118.23 TRINITY_DN7304_c5_g1_i1:77-2116(+)
MDASLLVLFRELLQEELQKLETNLKSDLSKEVREACEQAIAEKCLQRPQFRPQTTFQGSDREKSKESTPSALSKANREESRRQKLNRKASNASISSFNPGCSSGAVHEWTLRHPKSSKVADIAREYMQNRGPQVFWKWQTPEASATKIAPAEIVHTVRDDDADAADASTATSTWGDLQRSPTQSSLPGIMKFLQGSQESGDEHPSSREVTSPSASSTSPNRKASSEKLKTASIKSHTTSTVFEKRHTEVDMQDHALALVGAAARLRPQNFHSRAHAKAFALVCSPCFEWTVLAMVMASAVQVGIATEYSAQNLSSAPPLGHRVFETFFCVAFTLEIALRIFAFRFKFFHMYGWAWNWFDLVIVIMQLVEEILTATATSQSDGISSSSGYLLRTLRLLRAVRVMRVLKMALATQDLRLLVSSLIHSTKQFFWIAVLLAMITYVIGVYLTQLVTNQRIIAPQKSEALGTHFSSVPVAMLSLFEGLTGGVDWDELVHPLMYEVSPWLGLFFVIYTAFSLLVVMNIVTGTFVHNAITRAEDVKDMQKALEARQLFKMLDDDRSGVITFAEMQNQLENPVVKEYFESLDVDPSEAQCLFGMLDINNSGSIDFEEFLNGCLRLQGNAKALDLLLVTRETRSANDRHFQMLSNIDANIVAIGHMLQEDILGSVPLPDALPENNDEE